MERRGLVVVGGLSVLASAGLVGWLVWLLVREVRRVPSERVVVERLAGAWLPPDSREPVVVKIPSVEDVFEAELEREQWSDPTDGVLPDPGRPDVLVGGDEPWRPNFNGRR